MASGKASSWKKVKEDIAAGNFERFYIFFGEERYLLDFYKNELINAIVEDGMREFNFIELSEKINANDLADAIDSYPVMSERKVVLISDFDVFKADEDFKKRFTDMISDIPEYCTLLIVYPAEFKPDKRQKLYTAISKVCEMVDFARADKADLITWIKRRFKSEGKVISDDLCEYLIFYCGSLMQALIPEIEKIVAFSSDTSITRIDIDTVATPNAEAVVFDLTDAIVARKYSKALEILDKLMSLGEDPIAMLALIGRQMRQIYAACLLRGNGGISKLMSMWGMKSEYPAKIIMNASRGVDVNWARNSVILCAEADGKLKLGAKEEVLRELIAKLASFNGDNNA
ncbi:MAG: DNA polymerase III subunit delta [Clostridia bacterium]|nr:DNA polymerase III subunit delta [Clostridia bacterium]